MSSSNISIASSRNNPPAAVKRRSDSVSRVFYFGFICYYVQFFTDIVTLWSDIVSVEFQNALSFIACICFLFCYISSKRINVRSIVVVAIVASACIASGILAQTMSIIATGAMLIAASVYDDIKPLFRLWFRLTFALFCFLAIYYLLSYVFAPNTISVKERSATESFFGIAGERHFLFWGHPNTAGGIMTYLCIVYCYLNFNKLKKRHLFVILLIATANLFITGSQTATIAMVFLVVLVFAFQAMALFRKTATIRIIALIPVLLFIVSYLLIEPYWDDSMQQWLSTRLWSWHLVASYYDISIFGQQLNLSTIPGYWWGANVLDNSYIVGMYKFGLIICVLLCVGFYRAVMNADKNNDYGMIITLAVMAVIGFSESYMYMVAFAIPTLLLSKSLRFTKQSTFKVRVSAPLFRTSHFDSWHDKED